MWVPLTSIEDPPVTTVGVTTSETACKFHNIYKAWTSLSLSIDVSW